MKLATAVWLAAVTAAYGGDWTFVPKVDLEQRYDSNVLYLQSDPAGDYITQVGVELPVTWAGPEANFYFQYRPVDQQYLEYRDLSNLSQFAAIGGGGGGPRVRWNLDGSVGRTEDTRLAAGNGTEGPTPPEIGAPFVVVRTPTSYFLLRAGIEADLSARWTLLTGLEGNATNYSVPGLTDTRNAGLTMDASYKSSDRHSWQAGFRHERFGGQERLTSTFDALVGGAAHKLNRELEATWSLGVIVSGTGVFSFARATDRLFGRAALGGSTNVVSWTVGAVRDFTSGSGVAAVVRSSSVDGTVTFRVRRFDSVGTYVGVAQDRGVGFEVNRLSGGMRYGHTFRGPWSASVSAGVTEQNRGNETGVGTYYEKIVSVGFRYVPQGKS